MTQKLQKILAQAGLGSRREIERWIESGRIKVNHTIAKLGDRVDEKAHIEIDGQPFTQNDSTKSTPSILMYHKPVGELCTRHDPEGRPTVFDHLPKPPSGRWIVVGRLDYNTSGLLLFTNDGELANRLMHPSFHLMRTYKVRVYGVISDAVIAQLKRGVTLEDGFAAFDHIEWLSGEGKNHWYQVNVAMGKNRIVRRLWESQGIQVNRLVRIAFGPIQLPNSLQVGESQILKTAINQFLQK